MGLCCAGNDIVNIAGTIAHQLTRKFAEYYGHIVNKDPHLPNLERGVFIDARLSQ